MRIHKHGQYIVHRCMKRIRHVLILLLGTIAVVTILLAIASCAISERATMLLGAYRIDLWINDNNIIDGAWGDIPDLEEDDEPLYDRMDIAANKGIVIITVLRWRAREGYNDTRHALRTRVTHELWGMQYEEGRSQYEPGGSLSLYETYIRIPLWIPILIAMPYPSALLTIQLWRVMRRRRRRRVGLCVTCGYNLKFNTSGYCPECGGATKSLGKEDCEMGVHAE